MKRQHPLFDGWVVCWDESISNWTQQLTSSSWAYFSKMPNQFGNEYHTIYCLLKEILLLMEMVERKDHTCKVGGKPFSDLYTAYVFVTTSNLVHE